MWRAKQKNGSGQKERSMIIQDLKPMINHILSTLNNEINEVIIVLNNKDRIDKYKNFIKKEDYNFKITFAEDEIKNIWADVRNIDRAEAHYI